MTAIGSARVDHLYHLPIPDLPDAACRTIEYPDVFFPDTIGGPFQRASAKAICQGCPARTDCLTWSIEHNVEGIWGGLTEHERRQIKRSK